MALAVLETLLNKVLMLFKTVKLGSPPLTVVSCNCCKKSLALSNSPFTPCNCEINSSNLPAGNLLKLSNTLTNDWTKL